MRDSRQPDVILRQYLYRIFYASNHLKYSIYSKFMLGYRAGQDARNFADENFDVYAYIDDLLQAYVSSDKGCSR